MPTINFTNATGSFTYEETDVPPTNPNPPNPGPGEDWTPPAYLRTDVNPEETPREDKPGYLTPYTDPTFGTKIIRIGGDPGTAIKNISGAKWGDVSRHHYNSDQAWNCNQTLLYLDDPGIFLDGESYEPKFMQTGVPSDSDRRWHATDPALMLYAAGSKLGTWNPKSGATMLIKDFGNGYEGCKFGPWEGSPTEDGTLVAISCNQGGFAYNIAADKKYPNIDQFGDDVGNVRISPLGTYIVWGLQPDRVVVTDLEGNVVSELADNMVSHFDVTVGPDGEEYIVGRVNSGSVGMGKAGRLARYNMKDGSGMGLNTGGWCSHTSTRSKTHKYAVAGPTDESGGNPPYNGEIVMAALDGSACYRLGHTHEPDTYDYTAQTQPSHSPDGGRVIFASAWGGSGDEPRPVQSYVIDFRT